MSQTLQHQVKPSTDVSLPVQSEPQLQRRAFPHEVESQTDKAIASTKPISADWQAQQEKIARARFNPGMISLYPANPLKDEKEKPVQRKVDSIVESDETQTKPIQRRVESPPEADEGQAESIQRKTESTAQDGLEKDKPSSNKLVQTKLSVGKVGDRYEQEADQVAAKVMTMPDPSRNRIQRQPEQPESEIQPKPLAITPLVQRQASDEEVQTKATQEKQSQPDDTFEARLSGSMAGGSPLPEDVRAFMEPRLGASLKHVRAHTDFNATQMNKELGAQAFTYRNHIFYAAGKAPAKDELTAHELTHVIQQTGAKSLHPSAVGVPTRNTLQAKISRVSNPEEVQPKRAPASAKSDPAFQSVVTNTKAIAVEKKQHPPAQQKVTEVHAAAKPPSNDVESKAQDKQVQAMNQQQPGEFNAKAFQAALKQKIADVAPNTMQETEDFKNQNKVEEVKQDIASQVGNEKQQAAGPIEQKTQEAPNPKGITPKSVTPLPRKKLGKAGRVAAKGAAPKRKDESEVSLEAGSQQLDQQMSSAKVTEEQLKKSNEPKFQDAANAKKTAQTDAAKAPDQYRQREQGVVAGAEMQAQMTTSKDLDAMHTTQDRHVTQVLGKQGDAKGKDEQKRSHVSDHIQGIYNRTKQKVETILNQLDQDANHTFDQGATRAQNEFNDYVDRQMRMYKIRRYLSHPGGAFLWAKDKLLGLPDEVNVFYEQGRTRYLTSMDRAIAQVSNLVANRLKAAKAEITGGKKEIQTYVAGLEPSLRQVGQEAAKNIQSQFDDLEQSVNDKQNQLIESLAQKYNDNLKTLDDRINQMKDANKGLVQKAMDKVRDTINTIRDLTNMMMGVLRRAAGVIQLIIKDPIAFLTNLISGLKQGFLNFKANIGKHLQQGLMGFLTGTMGGTITMPSSFDPKGIFSLVTQVLGVTYASIRSKATGKWGEKKVGHLETSFDVFKTLKREGVGGLWNQIKGQIGDLKSLVLDGIRNFLIEKVVVAGVLWIISLFNPATAFIRACKAIVDIIRFFIERGSQIMELMNAVMDAIVAIAQGSLGAAAKLVESAMAKALPVVLGFIASLLGIGGLTKKVQDIIQKVRKPIDKGIDQVFGKADKFIKTLGGKAKDSKLGQKAVLARDSAKKKKEEAQKWAEEKKEAGRRAIEQQKDKLKQKITAGKNKFANSKIGQKLAAVDQWAQKKIDGLKNKWDKAKKLPGKALAGLKSKGKDLWDKAKNKFDRSKLGQKLGIGKYSDSTRRDAKEDKPIRNPKTFEEKKHNLNLAKKEVNELLLKSKDTKEVETHFPKIKKTFKLKKLEWKKLGTPSASIRMEINPSAEISVNQKGELVLSEGANSYEGALEQKVIFTTGAITIPMNGNGSPINVTVGRKMEAFRLGFTHPQGSSTNTTNLKAIMDILPGSTRNAENNYIRGHLLNYDLGGPGDDRNLFPITANANQRHGDEIESTVKDWVNRNGYWVYYKVEVSGGDNAIPLTSSSRQNLYKVNSTLHCEASKLKADGSQLSSSKITQEIQSVYGNKDSSKYRGHANNPNDSDALKDKEFDIEKVKWLNSPIMLRGEIRQLSKALLLIMRKNDLSARIMALPSMEKYRGNKDFGPGKREKSGLGRDRLITQFLLNPDRVITYSDIEKSGMTTGAQLMWSTYKDTIDQVNQDKELKNELRAIAPSP